MLALIALIALVDWHTKEIRFISVLYFLIAIIIIIFFFLHFVKCNVLDNN